MSSFIKLPKRPKIKGFKHLCPFFLLCIDINNIEKLQNVTKAITLKYLDFTRLKGTFEEKIIFSYMVYNEKL